MKLSVIAILVATAFAACTTTAKEKKALLPDSSGHLTEIIVLSDKATLDSAFKLQVAAVFSQPLPGQPPPGEQVFKILFANEDFFSGYFKKHHNIFILLTAENSGKLKKVIPENLIDKLVKVHTLKAGILGVKQESVFAQNQNIFVVLAENKQILRQKLEEKKNELLAIAKNHENETGKYKLLGETKAINDKPYQQSLTDRGFGVRVPKSYRVAMNKSDFLWIRKQITKEEKDMSILLFEVPYSATSMLRTDSLLAIRNKFTKKHIPGEIKGSYMKYSEAFVPVRKDQNFKEKYSVEIRGWWDVQGDFMGGPSYLRAVVDEANGRLVFAEGFLFYPNENKAKSMRELEILVNTLSIK